MFKSLRHIYDSNGNAVHPSFLYEIFADDGFSAMFYNGKKDFSYFVEANVAYLCDKKNTKKAIKFDFFD